MDTHIVTDIDGLETRVKAPGAGETALIADYGTVEHYIDLFKEHYEERRAEFFDSTANDPDLPDKAERFRSISRTCLRFARTLSNDLGENDNYHQIALDIADRIVKESGIVLRNLHLHYQLMKKELPKGDERLLCLSDHVEEGMKFFSRAMATELILHRRLNEVTGGAAGVELQLEAEAGERARALERKVPDGHMFLPARPYPALPIPEGLKVPVYPEPYARYKSVPVDDLVYDEEHDEFIIRPGYISEDGLIDDQSVVWNWDEGTVAIKFRGEEPEIWPFWKAKDASDVPKGWIARYLRRRYMDWAESLKWGILKRK